jgi:hypothetical protein
VRGEARQHTARKGIAKNDFSYRFSKTNSDICWSTDFLVVLVCGMTMPKQETRTLANVQALATDKRMARTLLSDHDCFSETDTDTARLGSSAMAKQYAPRSLLETAALHKFLYQKSQCFRPVVSCQVARVPNVHSLSPSPFQSLAVKCSSKSKRKAPISQRSSQDTALIQGPAQTRKGTCTC